MTYYAHTKEDGDWQLLNDHLRNVSALAARFARAGWKECAAFLGLLHDIGKYQPSFQQRLHDNRIRVDHSSCGAQEAARLIAGNARGNVVSRIFSYAVAGHHRGLPDIGNKVENDDMSVLRERLKNTCEDYSAYESEIGALLNKESVIRELKNALGPHPDRGLYEFAIRYLFSCLVDADCLDAENFSTGKNRPQIYADWELCVRELNAEISSFRTETALQRRRSELRDQALENVKTDAPVYLLNMPTGSGKTLCGVSLALYRLCRGRKKRIIYVIPYTSVVEQTAQVFEKLFPELTILQHHSGFDFDDATGKELFSAGDLNDENPSEILKKSTENWDVPFVITTNVQFFESIYSNRGSRLRKLHNMADSIIVFDEVHTLPVGFFVPCMQAIEQLTKNFGSEAILMTATMPDYVELYNRYGGRELPACRLIRDTSGFAEFDKCVLENICGEDISFRLDGSESVLAIFNTKKSAVKYYGAYSATKKYYLTTYLTPFDRRRAIDNIRADLKAGKKIAVFATSLVEAGVDLDFGAVYRELAGVDNILQAAGRCNREGKNARERSRVYIFTTECQGLHEIATKANITKGLLAVYGTDRLASAECVREYFNALYEAKAWTMAGREKYDGDIYEINFESVASGFKLIDSATVGVVIPCDDNAEELAKAENGYANKRKLQKYCATVSGYELKKLCESGVISEYGGVFVLNNPDYYSHETGLRIDGEDFYYGQ